MRAPVRRKLARPMTAALVAFVSLAACTDGARDPPDLRDAPSIREMARGLGADVVRRLRDGYVEGRSGEIQLVPEPWSVLGQWNGGVRGRSDPRTTHATPWDYHQRVPIVLNGPPFVRARVDTERPVTVASIGATLARLLGIRLESASPPLHEALAPGAGGKPRAILVVVYDGGGWNVLRRWPDSWPFLRRLGAGGTVYLNATAGSAPTVTAPIHASLGTGTLPREHGIVENTIRLPDGSIGDVFGAEAGDPSLLERTTVADEWDRATNGTAWLGLVGYDVWHLPMMGAGSPGGDRDAAFLWDRHAEEIGAPWAPIGGYELPGYAPTTSFLDRQLRRLDITDGAGDDRWREGDLTNEFEIPGTPAFASFSGEAALRFIQRSPVGRDAVTDLVFVELKASDYAGHLWNMESVAERDVLLEQDRILASLVGALRARAGRGRYAVIVTADHGQTPNPVTTGGLRIDRYAVGQDIEAAFGDVVDDVHPAQVFLDVEALEASGASVEDVARFLGAYPYGEAVPEGTDVSTLPEGSLDRPAFAAALPGSYLDALTPGAIDALGVGRYPEGDLTTPDVRIRRLVRG